MERARLVRLMKTVVAIRERANSRKYSADGSDAGEQLTEIMPELEDVGPGMNSDSDAAWTNTVGLPSRPWRTTSWRSRWRKPPGIRRSQAHPASCSGGLIGKLAHNRTCSYGWHHLEVELRTAWQSRPRPLESRRPARWSSFVRWTADPWKTVAVSIGAVLLGISVDFLES